LFGGELLFHLSERSARMTGHILRYQAHRKIFTSHRGSLFLFDEGLNDSEKSAAAEMITNAIKKIDDAKK
jgi:hypothetical protein